MVLIAGPTASGKSAAALALAEAAATGGASIVNADAMQVYRELRILTARPREADEAQAPHRLYGHVPPAVRYSVGAWLTTSLPCCAKHGRGRAADHRRWYRPLFQGADGRACGGPDIPLDVRDAMVPSAFKAKASQRSMRCLRSATPRRAPPSARVIAQRVLRALEVFEVTGLTSTSARIRRRCRHLFRPERRRLF